MSAGINAENGPINNWQRLEVSWRALQAFQKSHTGRIGTDAQLESRLSVDEGIIDVNGFDHDESDISSGDETVDFIIPELPSGQTLRLKILSTWGDPYYVGLNGIEIFSANGSKITPHTIECSEHADAIPDCCKIDNLVDGNYRTRDDTRLWLTAFDHNNPLVVTLHFDDVCTIAMIRIWNYNKSRIHSSRGVKLLEMQLDEQTIFRGEISKAAGCYLETDILGDTVLFTTDDDILELISENDQCIDHDDHGQPDDDALDSSTNSNSSVRPSTGERPTSRKLVRQTSTSDDKTHDALRQMYSVEGSAVIVKGSVVTLQLVSNWGYEGSIGLTGLQLLDRKGKPMAVTKEMITCSQGANIDRLINHKCLTTDTSQMFFTSFTPGQPININMYMTDCTGLQGMTIWNYNGSGDKSYAGVRSLNMLVDDELVLRDIMLRKAPGNMHYDFAQDIAFGEHQLGITDWALNAITGFVLQIQLLSTWGDDFYGGLNGIELLNADGKAERISMKNLAAYPESVNVLPSVKDDPRSSDKLIDHVNDTTDPQHMWLAPIIPNQINRVYLVFDCLKSMHALRIYNYRKTAQRGIRDILVLLDDLIVYSGEIPVSTDTETGCLTIDFTTGLAT